MKTSAEINSSSSGTKATANNSSSSGLNGNRSGRGEQLSAAAGSLLGSSGQGPAHSSHGSAGVSAVTAVTATGGDCAIASTSGSESSFLQSLADSVLRMVGSPEMAGNSKPKGPGAATGVKVYGRGLPIPQMLADHAVEGYGGQDACGTSDIILNLWSSMIL
jgi:hypothetical protein